MGSPFKIVSNSARLSISLSIATMWGDIVVNNVKATLVFKCSPLLVSLLEFLFFETNQVDWMGFFY